MKSAVSSSGAAIFVTLVFSAASLVADVVSPCNSPPGRQVRCEDGQIAVCTVDAKGQVFASCKRVATDIRGVENDENKQIAVVIWIVQELATTGIVPAGSGEEVTQSKALLAFTKRHIDLKGGYVIRFRLPTDRDERPQWRE